MFSEELLRSKLLSLFRKLNDAGNMGNEGTIIALEMVPQEYLLSQITHLIEQNNAKVLSAFSYMEEGKQIVLLKIDLEDASSVLQSLERFNYTVIDSFQKEMRPTDTIRNRIDELMHYLEL